MDWNKVCGIVTDLDFSYLLDGTEEDTVPVVTTSEEQPLENSSEAVTTSGDSLDFSYMLDGGSSEVNAAATTDVPEVTDRMIDNQDENQMSLSSYYYNLHPEIYDTEEYTLSDGSVETVPTKIKDVSRAKELGLIRDIPTGPVVPTGDTPLGNIEQTPTTEGLGVVYNQRDAAVNQQKAIARKDMSRLERGAAERKEEEVNIQAQADEAGLTVDEYTEQVLLPESFTEKDAPVLNKLFSVAPWSYDILDGAITGLEIGADGFQDGLEFVFEGMNKHTPELYEGLAKTLTGGKVSPKTLAKQGGREAYNFLVFSDSLGAGVSGVVTRTATALSLAKETRASLAAGKKFDDAVQKQIEVKDTLKGLMGGKKAKAAYAAAGKEVKAAKENLNKAVDAEIKAVDAKKAKIRKDAEEAVDKRAGRKMNISVAKQATEMDIAAKTEAAKKAAAGQVELSTRVIKEFEQKIGARSADNIDEIIDETKIISTDKDGVLTIDGDKARAVGLETANQVAEKKGGTLREFLTGNSLETEAALQADILGELTQPLLKSDKFDGIIAAAAELKERIPKAFDNNKTVIDNLFELTVNKDAIPGDELIDILNKYNISFEDYVLTVVGSGSEAGRLLQKLSAIKRMRPTNELVAMQEAITTANQGKIRDAVMRVEGIRRGGLVSQLATAARNLQSAGVRAPLEGLGNVMDTALLNLSDEGVAAGAKALVSKANWEDSFRHMKYMFGQNATDTKDYVDFILKQPELSKQFDMMFNNINEIQMSTGRGRTKAQQVERLVAAKREAARAGKRKFDAVAARQEAVAEADSVLSGTTGESFAKGFDNFLSELEDGVGVLNGPNRWQEYLVRRASFLGELERLVKREYNIDLIDTINDGKIRDLLNDASSVRPEGARAFKDIIADATDKALDVTYAKQPDIPVFRSTAQFITRNGLTAVIAFPRFMFNSMELMGQYAAGASIPLTRKMIGIVNPKFRGKLTAKDRQRISRNIIGAGVAGPVVPAAIAAASNASGDKDDPNIITDALLGMSAVGAAFMYRSDKDAPSDYKMLKTDLISEGSELDTTPQFPIRQFLYMGEATKRLRDGTFDDWFNAKELADTFMGTSIRTGVGSSIINEVRDLFVGTDLTKDERAGRAAGRILGTYLSSWAVPFAQIIEAQRAAGVRGTTMKDSATDPTLDFADSFEKAFKRPFTRFESAKDEAARPKRESLFQEEKKRVAPIARVALGLNISSADSEAGEYIKNLGLTEFQLGSSSKVGSIRRFENEQLRNAIPDIVYSAKAYEGVLRDKFRTAKPIVRKKMTEQEYVNSKTRSLITTQIKSLKTKLTEGKRLSAYAPAYVEASTSYRRLPPEIRKSAAVEFLEREGRYADGTSTEDLAKLSIIGKALKDAYK